MAGRWEPEGIRRVQTPGRPCRRVRLLVPVLAALALAGCAADLDDPASPATNPPLVSATPSPEPTSPRPSAPAAPRLGILFEETYAYRDRTDETRREFVVEPGVAKLTFFVDAAGPPPERGFTSAVMDVFAPRTTSPMFAELPGQEKRSYTQELTVGEPHHGTWMVRFAGTGDTSVTLRVVAE